MVTDPLTLRTELQDFETHVPLDAQRLIRFVCRKDGDIAATRGHVAVFTAMEKEQTRERERYTRPIARVVGIASGQKSPPPDPLRLYQNNSKRLKKV